MVDQMPLADRVRDALASEPSTRTISMFGGLSFMVNDKMVVAVDRDGGLLVRVDPARHDELVGRPGAAQAEMGAGRTMGPGWISVAVDALATDDELSFWMDVALDYHDRAGPRGSS